MINLPSETVVYFQIFTAKHRVFLRLFPSKSVMAGLRTFRRMKASFWKEMTGDSGGDREKWGSSQSSQIIANLG
jgi:hypothetical protein